MNGLTPGRIVHYLSPDLRHLPAIVGEVTNQEQGVVNLMVFDVSLLAEAMGKEAKPVRGVSFSEEKTGHTWHWVEPA